MISGSSPRASVGTWDRKFHSHLYVGMDFKGRSPSAVYPEWVSNATVYVNARERSPSRAAGDDPAGTVPIRRGADGHRLPQREILRELRHVEEFEKY